MGQGLRLLGGHRELWIWCALPVVLNVLFFGLALAVFLNQLDPLTAHLQALLDVAEPSAWYEWLWIGPLRGLAWLVRAALLGLFAVIVYLLFTLIGGVLASPFLEMLSARVESLQTGQVREESLSFARAAARSMWEEGKRTSFFLSIQLGFIALGLVPGLQLVAAGGAFLFAVLFLPLDYTGYVMDRRRLRFRERRRWIVRHARSLLGFGLAAFASFFVPGLNFLCLPWLVTSGTLLALEIGLPGDEGAP